MSNVIIINSDSMGQDDNEIGKTILGSFFRKLALQSKKPDVIIFYNAGVKLLAEGSSFLSELEVLQTSGVELVACGTCVGYFKLVNKIAIGRVSDMQEIVQLLMNSDNVVTL